MQNFVQYIRNRKSSKIGVLHVQEIGKEGHTSFNHELEAQITSQGIQV
jgi:hypothetical protein